MDDTDRRIMRATQAGLPLTPEPYQTLAEQLGLTKEDIMQRMAAMHASGIIRRIGAVPNHYKLGYRFNGMTVWDVPDDNIDELGQQVGQLPFVSHCYHRPRHLPDWPYNLFAMVHGKTQAEADGQIVQIAEVLGEDCRGRDVLYSTKILKKTGFRSGDRLVAVQDPLASIQERAINNQPPQPTRIVSRKSIRLPNYDYSQNGAYFITICTHNRTCMFGEIQNGIMQANTYGNLVLEEWQKSAAIRNEIELDEFVLMPNHIHAIIFIHSSGERLFADQLLDDQSSTKPNKHLKPKSLGALVAGFKSSVTAKINTQRNSPGQAIWQRNYYDRVLRDESELLRAREYIINNPMQWDLDEENPECRK